MTEELEDKLIKRFPLMYRSNNYGVNQEKFCFECCDYLFDLIWETPIKIENVLSEYPYIYMEEFSVIQVKTKFTMFYFYIDFSDFAKNSLDNNMINMILSRINDIARKSEIDGRKLNERESVKV